MRRGDRLFEIIQILRTRRGATTAQHLADELEVSERTVYRDIQDLMASGVPIEGEAGVGYVLRRGFDLPPLMFTHDEIAALVAGARWVQSWTEPKLGRAAARALSKIETVAPPALRVHMGATPLFMPNSDNAAKVSLRLAPIRQAIDAQCKLALRYTREGGATTARTVVPLGCFFWGPVWTLAAWCELRDDFRSFRLDRIGAIEVMSERFEAVRGRGLADYLRHVCRDDEGAP